ncbi:hypothetical protein FE257_009596 [Aspergillus nanangensis]|uniref:FAD-binding domain-containing protein n=1 Tax=Aspergillus nanangensis TaxID=2582783 RepID=A0AAD4CJR7_ASPNN|nr:hypothetical protein FE257_009596 [Aspergillus nanangensis]
MAPFKVVIVGGSIAGLSLANILERYRIDYVLVEKQVDIAPQLGASVALWPYGLRLVDQLGMMEEVKSCGMPMTFTRNFDPEGRPLAPPIALGNLLEELLGYQMWFLDRQNLLQILFNNIKDKSRIHTSCEVCKIEQRDGSVEVVTKDGVSFHGDIVVGADGVHSPIRQEIWRLADSEVPNHPPTHSKENIICLYRCMFGISDRPDGFQDDHGYKTFKNNHSYLYQAGGGGKLYWFAFFKNPIKTTLDLIPQYTTEDAENLAAEYADDVLYQGLTFGDGGNSAIESAAILADMLKEALEQTPSPSDETIRHLFSEFQRERRPRTRSLMKASRILQDLDALATPLLKFLHLNVTGKLGLTTLAPRIIEAATPGYALRYVPPTSHSGTVALEREVFVKPEPRSTTATTLWIFAILLSSVLSLILTAYLGVGIESTKPIEPSIGEALELYSSMISIAINGIWVVESYRASYFMTLLCSAIPFVLASSILGWVVVVPIYFAMHIYSYRFSGREASPNCIVGGLHIAHIARYNQPFFGQGTVISDCHRKYLTRSSYQSASRAFYDENLLGEGWARDTNHCIAIRNSGHAIPIALLPGHHIPRERNALDCSGYLPVTDDVCWRKLPCTVLHQRVDSSGKSMYDSYDMVSVCPLGLASSEYIGDLYPAGVDTRGCWLCIAGTCCCDGRHMEMA